MSNVVVMTDNVACIPSDVAEKNRIKIVPTASILFDGKAYTEGIDITASEAYELITRDPDKFETSPAAPGLLMDEYRKASVESNEILMITLASKLSAFFNTASVAAEHFQKEWPEITIRIVDSRTCAGAQGLVVLAVAKEAAKGTELNRLAGFAEEVRQKTGGVMLLDTLRYIYRTGRMTKDEALKAAKLKIKPINRMTDEGTVEPVDIVRKRTDGYSKLLELIRKESGTDALHFIVSHANAPEIAERFVTQLRQEFNCLSVIISDYSPVMGYGAGPGAMFVGFQPELDL